jgi:diaminopimelate epimerase
MTPFRKMHGLGNDFVVFDARHQSLALTSTQVRRLADRRFGVGCDTVVVIGQGGASADASLLFHNANGSEIEACGNATRCVARFLMDERGLARVRLSTRGSLLLCEDAGNGLVAADMGTPIVEWKTIPLAEAVDTIRFPLAMDGNSFDASAVSMGNPHCVLFVADAEKAPVATLGPRIETLPLFPNKVNVEFAQVLDNGRIRMRVWERGIGITMACGTGACATAVAAIRRGLTGRKVEVQLDGGSLQIEWREDNHVVMTGPAAIPFQGELDLAKFA